MTLKNKESGITFNYEKQAERKYKYNGIVTIQLFVQTIKIKKYSFYNGSREEYSLDNCTVAYGDRINKYF
jgi:hypothetical protein